MKKIFFACALSVLSSAAFAEHPNTGCGLGSTLIENQDSIFKQIFATTTNGTSGNQTFGITSGTLGCEKPAKVVLNDQVNTFVALNMDGLATDIANGHGEILNTLASLLAVQDKSAFMATLQKNFGAIYTSENVSSANVIDHIVAVAG